MTISAILLTLENQIWSLKELMDTSKIFTRSLWILRPHFLKFSWSLNDFCRFCGCSNFFFKKNIDFCGLGTLQKWDVEEKTTVPINKKKWIDLIEAYMWILNKIWEWSDQNCIVTKRSNFFCPIWPQPPPKK